MKKRSLVFILILSFVVLFGIVATNIYFGGIDFNKKDKNDTPDIPGKVQLPGDNEKIYASLESEKNEDSHVYPDISHETVKELLGALEKKEDILDLVSQPESDGINVVIGSESSVKVMNNSALVFKPVVRDGKTLGAIGIIGPRRMDYAKVVATIEGLAENVESLLNESGVNTEKLEE